MVAPATLTRIVRVRILLPQPSGSVCCRFFRGIAQMVARCVRDAEALSSNLNTPTIPEYTFGVFRFFVHSLIRRGARAKKRRSVQRA